MKAEDKYEKLITGISPYYKFRKGVPSNTLKLVYNSSAEGLEPVYFWLLDFMDSIGGNVTKIEDTFQSTVGSGHFSELMGKATRMQEEGMKIMQTIGVLIKSVINIIYDLKQFEIRLNDYKVANGKDEKVDKASGILALKQTWLDNVDIKRGNSSMKAMTFSQQGAFVTLLNAFFMVNSEKDIDNADLNDIVKRLLKQRLQEFLVWKDYSELELRKRYDIERHWLKSQVDSLKLYSKWATPYFEAAEQLRMNKETTSPDLVNTFNSLVLKLTLLKKDPIKIEQSVIDRELPKGFEKLDAKGRIRKYYAFNIIEFRFRGIPSREGQHYTFGGLTEVTFKSFALNEDEVNLFDSKLNESELNTALNLAQSVTQDSLKEIEKDIEYFTKTIDNRDKNKPEEKKENKEDVNPFSALIGFGSIWGKEKYSKEESGETPEEKAEKKKAEIIEKLKKGLKKENYAERVVRALAEQKAKKTVFTVYDVYKKAHGMASVPISDYSPSFQAQDIQPRIGEIFQ